MLKLEIVNDEAAQARVVAGYEVLLAHFLEGTKESVQASDTSESQWFRSKSTSIWHGPNLELIVVQNAGSDESWSWTARGWREPDECDGADRWGWVNTSSREACEKAAIRWYMDKDG